MLRLGLVTFAACAHAFAFIPTRSSACTTRRGLQSDGIVPRGGAVQMQKNDEAAANTEGVGKLLGDAQGELLSIGEKVQRGTSSSWVNPACNVMDTEPTRARRAAGLSLIPVPLIPYLWQTGTASS